jgi:uncharacterized protein YndB with AHSA1/START domain
VTAPVARAGMLIRRPVGEVFEAFADPAVTSRFWFTKGSGRLEPGARFRWDWEMYGVGTDVLVKAIEPGRRILIDWNTADDPTEVEWLFEARGDATPSSRLRTAASRTVRPAWPRRWIPTGASTS